MSEKLLMIGARAAMTTPVDFKNCQLTVARRFELNDHSMECLEDVSLVQDHPHPHLSSSCRAHVSVRTH
jgi:hypothetical protein